MALHEELLASVLSIPTTELDHADIFPLGTTGLVMTLLWLPDQQLVVDKGWEVIL